MVVVTANYIPDAVRGKMKMWFIEIKPNVFVSGINDQVAKKVLSYLFSRCSFLSGITILVSKNKAPGYEIFSLGSPQKKIIEISGLQLITNRVLDKKITF